MTTVINNLENVIVFINKRIFLQLFILLYSSLSLYKYISNGV